KHAEQKARQRQEEQLRHDLKNLRLEWRHGLGTKISDSGIIGALCRLAPYHSGCKQALESDVDFSKVDLFAHNVLEASVSARKFAEDQAIKKFHWGSVANLVSLDRNKYGSTALRQWAGQTLRRMHWGRFIEKNLTIHGMALVGSLARRGDAKA